ncbi:ABC transporter ATP-binding protein [Mangrovibrevibacter kandeliae]|uniref:ABC transporter ATP-binding protein n=1 Tax=Mangrovibrevibacter kandeliae TaxID=2968473 RepID=UPI0021185B3D|nr:ABC transporter ATP-binding protein [Aurantimonas sp. CSK15Z-1]MCQ8781587.1 ABC transporter ATP-binding protein [Aurantimonas sp. CSK15Z-1]
MSEALLEIRDLHLTMSSFDGLAHVLNGVDLTVRRGEVWGVVGESGCGKSLTGLSISRLVPTPPARYPQGSIRFEGEDLMRLAPHRMQALRGKRIGMIFQDPTTNLNPTVRIGEQLVDVALAAASHDPSLLDDATPQQFGRRRQARDLAARLLERVGIPDAQARLASYPHEFSGGMRQRVLIAMALIGRPDLLIADEPTTALDVSVQAQILKLIQSMVADHDIGVILITHNLGVVAETCTHVAVMYAGNVVETGPVAAVIERPAHPYTRALMAAIPMRDTPRGQLQGLPGVVPDLIRPPPGCRFAPRCDRATAECRARFPGTGPVAPGHAVACYHPVRQPKIADG